MLNNSTLLKSDFSYNNLSGPEPRFAAKTFNIAGNALICPTAECFGATFIPMSMNLNSKQASSPWGRRRSHNVALAFGFRRW
ncbi:protein NSP-INTERACTING KINASE 1-like [Mercurialis annua]|uniref:protein NSP-INTERACTING KINASE 1-like n=1 Tax=Mercurialis annua TaxID=3986 RepID=UPI002160CCDC|nr:protein NSP-INTERACTING KINASE 1-like [Mercurialis annua]